MRFEGKIENPKERFNEVRTCNRGSRLRSIALVPEGWYRVRHRSYQFLQGNMSCRPSRIRSAAGLLSMIGCFSTND